MIAPQTGLGLGLGRPLAGPRGPGPVPRHAPAGILRRRNLVRAASEGGAPTPGDAPVDPPGEGPELAFLAKASSTAESDLMERMEELRSRLLEAQRALAQTEERQRALAPYRVSAPKRGIVGNSRYARALRKQIVAASRDRRRAPVLIFGEPGLQKTNVAALIHFGSPFSNAPLVSIDCDRLDDDASELIGRGAKKGLLYWVPNDGTLILNNVHKAPPSVMPILQREVATASLAASMDDDGCVADFSLGTLNSDDEDDLGMAGFGRSGGVLDPEVDVLTAAGTPARRRLPACRFPRIIMTGETRAPALEEQATVIKVPPLRVRPEDVDDLARYLLRTISRQRGLGPISLTPDALRQLEAGQYPNNVAELTAAVERAVAQSIKSSGLPLASAGGRDGAKAMVIGEEVFWFAGNPARERLRLDLLRSVPNLRRFLRSEVWPNKINFEFTVYAFAALVAILFLGPQDREHNFALNAFWCYWWPISFLVFPFLGRIWCAVCPFMIYGELVQAWRKASGAKLMKWPKEALDRWGPWFLFWMFAGILVWEEVWDLPHTAALSSWLLLLITAGAMVGSFFFERRVWCRYLCPIGGMNGLFAKLSMTELRARQGVCSAQCDTYTCYKGGPAVPPEGQESVGCPVYSHPAQLADNRNCVLCFECGRACPHRSIQVNLRVPGADLWDGTHVPIVAESWLMFMLLGAVYLHDLPTMLGEMGIEAALLTAGKLAHIGISAVVLAAPGAAAWAADAGWRALAGALAPAPAPVLAPAQADPAAARAISLLQSASASYTAAQAGAPIQAPAKPFLDLSYGYLPFVWGATLSYYLRYGLTEAGRILPVAAETFGLSPAPAWLPTLEAPQDVVGFCQAVALLAGTALSLGMTRRIAGQPWKVVAPQCLVILGFTVTLWDVILPW